MACLPCRLLLHLPPLPLGLPHACSPAFTFASAGPYHKPALPPSRLRCRWFHGACAKVSQEDVDALGDSDTWNCAACKAYKRQQERAAARNQR